MSGFQMIAVDDLVRRQDARPLDDRALVELEDSIRRLGLLNPLTVRPIPGGMFEVLAGCHRFAASQAAGFHEIACQVLDIDDLRAELVMIDENLARHPVSGILLEKQLSRRKAIHVELHPQTAHGGSRRVDQVAKLATCSDGAENVDRFTAEAAALTGKSERTIQRAVERGEKIGDDAAALIQGTALDVGAYRQILKDVPSEEQVARVQRDLAQPVRRPAAMPQQPKPAPGVSFVRFLDLAADMGKLEPQDIADGIPHASRRAELMTHVRSLLAMLERVDEIVEGGGNA